MGNIPVYSAQRSPLTSLPGTRASPEAFGAGIGRALQGIGGKLVGMSDDLRARQERKANTSADVALARARSDMTEQLISAEANAPAGGEGLKTDFVKTFDEYEAKTAGSVPAEARDRFKVGMAGLRATLDGRAASAEAKMSAAKQTADVRDGLATSINTVLLDPTQYDEATEQGIALIDNLGLPADDRDGLKRDFVNAAASARFKALFTAAKTPDDIAAVRADLAAGKWKEIMGADAFGSLVLVSGQAEKSLRKILKDEAAADVTGLRDRITQGADIDPSDIASTTEKVRQAADTALAERWARLRVEYDTRQKGKRLSTTDLRTYADETRDAASVPPDIAENATRASAFVGGVVSSNYLLATRRLESGGNDNAAATTSSAVGPYQFVAGTWMALIPKVAERVGVDLEGSSKEEMLALRKDPEIASYMAAEFAAQNKRYLVDKLGRDVTEAELYIAHFAGAGGAAKLIAAAESNPDQSAAALMPEAAKANRSIFYKKGLHAEGPRGRARTVEEVYHLLADKFDRAPSQLGWVRTKTARDMLDERRKRIAGGDLMGVASDAGIADLGELSDAQSFQVRARQASVAAEYFDAAAAPFRPDEVSHFKDAMDTGSIEDKLSLLANVASMGSGAKSAFEQINEKAPLFGFAGGLSEAQPETAREILRGAQKLQDNPDVKAALHDTNAGTNTASSFAGIVGGALDQSPAAAYGARLAADALYVQRAGLGGVANFDQDAYNQAVRDVLGAAPGQREGGLAEINGEPTVLPPGVSEDEFDNMLDALTPLDLVRFSVGGGAPRYGDGAVAAPDEISREGKFRAVGAGTYSIVMADGEPLLNPDGPNSLYFFQVDKSAVSDVLGRDESSGAPAIGFGGTYFGSGAQ
ncbi:MAG: hypothetical protein Q8P46_06995 [Hyphomicrobiales bacterium]|nr:hypothetical protein [Hyphomicrobiales bacterium]